MKSYPVLLIVAFTATIVVAIAGVNHFTAGGSGDELMGTAPKLVKWEVMADTNVDPVHLADVGKQGWELVSVEPFDGKSQGLRTLWYKRKVGAK